eukprot:TRINITY_DN1976_c0_g1_i14.p2 TRINITY_DN1976_c0_g1~~TRINITY_DN1976_c0_g1_i14.p2  ORF type:complete len:175 (+),score=34.62 TRINITY_DN1976_c0_g1_i14:173-697(+)
MCIRDRYQRRVHGVNCYIQKNTNKEFKSQMEDISLIVVIIGVLVLIAIIAIYKYSKPSMIQGPNINLDPAKLPHMSLDELHQNNGKNGSKIYIALKQNVYDVSNSQFYKEGGSYAMFAGQEISVNLAKMDFNGSLFNTYKDGSLNQKEEKILQEWEKKYDTKYKKVAILIQHSL